MAANQGPKTSNMTRNPDPVTPSPPGSVELPDARDTRPAPSGTRRTSEAPIAEPWRDALLRISTSLPIDIAPEDLGRMFLERVALLFPSASLGICIAQPGHAEPVVLYRMQPGARRGPERHPTRLFPGYSEERIRKFLGGNLLRVFRQITSPSER